MKRKLKVRSVSNCPFDKEPCAYVSSCDDVLSLTFGLDLREDASCPRAVVKVGKK